RTSDKVLEAHCFCIQPDRLIGITLHDITTSSVKRSMVVKKAQEVIRKNLSSVQQIAGLLGENAAETEILLNQLIETFDPEDVPRGGRQ
ncbi:MAG: histidine kinase, partial [Spirochaetota bacterium]